MHPSLQGGEQHISNLMSIGLVWFPKGSSRGRHAQSAAVNPSYNYCLSAVDPRPPTTQKGCGSTIFGTFRVCCNIGNLDKLFTQFQSILLQQFG